MSKDFIGWFNLFAAVLILMNTLRAGAPHRRRAGYAIAAASGLFGLDRLVSPPRGIEAAITIAMFGLLIFAAVSIVRAFRGGEVSRSSERR